MFTFAFIGVNLKTCDGWLDNGSKIDGLHQRQFLNFRSHQRLVWCTDVFEAHNAIKNFATNSKPQRYLPTRSSRLIGKQADRKRQRRKTKLQIHRSCWTGNDRGCGRANADVTLKPPHAPIRCIRSAIVKIWRSSWTLSIQSGEDCDDG